MFLSMLYRYYESLYDTAEYLKVNYPPNLSPEEQLEYETEAAKVPLYILYKYSYIDCEYFLVWWMSDICLIFLVSD